MDAQWDVVVVGAGPAGCAAAYDLAATGLRVLLLDRRTFPRSKACACGLTRKTLKALRYSVEPVIERRCHDVVLQEAGPAFASGARSSAKSLDVRVRTRTPFCVMAVRERFDAFCLEQTLRAGAVFRKIESVIALRQSAAGVELEIALSGGTSQVLRAPVVIGADGSNGQMRRLTAGLDRFGLVDDHDATVTESHTVRDPARPTLANDEAAGEEGAPKFAEVKASTLPAEPAWYARGFALEATVPFSALPAELPGGDRPLDLVFDFSPIAGGYAWLFPKGDHINIGVGGFVPQAPGGAGASGDAGASGSAAAGEAGTHYENASRALLATYTRAKLGVDLEGGVALKVTGQYLGLGGHAYQPQGRVLLAGDAAGLIDPLTGEGIHSAVVSGQAAAAAVLASRGEAEGEGVAAAYTERLRPLQETLRFSHRAAASFYREPGRGFKIMRTPVLRGLVLKTYADGLPVTKLLTKLARRVAS